MSRFKAAREASVRPRAIDVVARIDGGGIVSGPSIVASVDVRNIRMTFRVDRKEVLGPASACRGRSLLSPGSLRRSGTASGDVSAANRRGGTYRPPPAGAGGSPRFTRAPA